MMIITILQTANPEVTSLMDLLSYGVLGIFAVLMIFAIKRLVEYINSQNDKMVQTYIEQAKLLNADKKALIVERDELNNSFLIHLKNNEGKFLEIVSENSKAFNAVALSNESVSDAIALLVTSINERNKGASELDASMKEFIITNKK